MRTFLAIFMGLAFMAGCAQDAKGPNIDVILAEEPAGKLSDYGLFLDDSATQPVPGVVAYDLVNPLFSDYAQKDRFVFTPGKPARYVADEVFEFPVGSVLVKSFSYPETGLIETRILIHKQTGWAAYPYVWNADRTEAFYAPIGARSSVSTTDPAGDPLTIAYAVPNQNQCKTCHQAGRAIMPIGPKARNLDHVGPYGAPQLADWEARGLVAGVPVSVEAVPALADGMGSVESRARAYLDINCAHCHKPDGSASNSGLWLSWTEDEPTHLGIGKHPTAAGRGSGQHRLVIEEGEPDASILLYRMASSEPGVAMPELGRTQIDDAGVELIRAWIASIDSKKD